ncbi:hypothetical protein R6258_18465 [Halomonas sp. HP20-15]|uniref:hypothetical protein n=1 Tax=Halomonas sp. HP20-15 TaxID=3085901 RepID=UPI002982532D|nr:hypothetical protein [Halomonas sp. HP20-15]MDW5378905.1 hypothetical protein [Halomonas sp. HP20-15]
MDARFRPPERGIGFKATCLRASLYIITVGVLMQGVYYESTYLQGSRFSEFGLTELLQSLLLAISIGLLALEARRSRPLRQVATLLLAFLLASLIREQDSLLDDTLFDGAWQLLVTLVVVPALGWTIYQRRRFVAEFGRYADSFAFGLFASGFLCTYVFSRLYGRGSFWEVLTQAHYQYLFKRAAEEITELFGYQLILFAVIELTLLARRLTREQP